MARIEKNSLLASLHGSIGQLTIVHRKGAVFARNKPTVKPKATRRRKAHQGKFRQASKWASGVLKEVPALATIYQEAAKGTELSAQNLMIADFMHGPVIDDIDLSGYTGRSGEKIRVQGKDSIAAPIRVELGEVRVVIRNLAGAVLEQGNAVQDGAVWVYVTQTEVPPTQIVNVEVIVKDRPLNRASKIVPHLTRTEA
jgi:hypothetical protein